MNAINVKNPLSELLPADLSRVVGKPTLMRMAFEAVELTEWPRPLRSEPNCTPEPVLRTLLAYCYCVGVFSSREIEASAKFDSSIQYLCANDFPTWEQVRQFRRHNISHLRETLARMLRAVAEEIGEGISDSFFPYLAEADRRLRLAMEADSAAMDD
jgi:hypothetical protein